MIGCAVFYVLSIELAGAYIALHMREWGVIHTYLCNLAILWPGGHYFGSLQWVRGPLAYLYRACDHISLFRSSNTFLSEQ